MHYFATAISVLFCVLTGLSYKIFKTPKTANLLSVICVFLSALGVLMAIVSQVVFEAEIKNASLVTGETVQWAKDMFTFSVSVIFAISGVVIIMSVASHFVTLKIRILRLLLICVSCIMFALITPYLAAFADNDKIDIASHISLTSAAASLITLFPLFFDLRKNAKTLAPEK